MAGVNEIGGIVSAQVAESAARSGPPVSSRATGARTGADFINGGMSLAPGLAIIRDTETACG